MAPRLRDRRDGRRGDRHPHGPNRRHADQSRRITRGTSRSAPDGSRAYVANQQSDTVSVIDTRTNQVLGAPIRSANPRASSSSPTSPRRLLQGARARPGVPLASTPRPRPTPTARSPPTPGASARASDRPLRSPGDPHLLRPRRLPGDAEPDRQRGLLGGADLHRPDGLLPRRRGGATKTATSAGSVAYPGVRVRCPTRLRAEGLQLQAPGRRQAPARPGEAESALARSGSSPATRPSSR